jgi:hypothetical protein
MALNCSSLEQIEGVVMSHSKEPWTIHFVGGPADGRVEKSKFLGIYRSVATRGTTAMLDYHTYDWQSVDEDAMTATAIYREPLSSAR